MAYRVPVLTSLASTSTAIGFLVLSPKLEDPKDEHIVFVVVAVFRPSGARRVDVAAV